MAPPKGTGTADVDMLEWLRKVSYLCPDEVLSPDVGEYRPALWFSVVAQLAVAEKSENVGEYSLAL